MSSLVNLLVCFAQIMRNGLSLHILDRVIFSLTAFLLGTWRGLAFLITYCTVYLVSYTRLRLIFESSELQLELELRLSGFDWVDVWRHTPCVWRYVFVVAWLDVRTDFCGNTVGHYKKLWQSGMTVCPWWSKEIFRTLWWNSSLWKEELILLNSWSRQEEISLTLGRHTSRLENLIELQRYAWLMIWLSLCKCNKICQPIGTPKKSWLSTRFFKSLSWHEISTWKTGNLEMSIF